MVGYSIILGTQTLRGALNSLPLADLAHPIVPRRRISARESLRYMLISNLGGCAQVTCSQVPRGFDERNLLEFTHWDYPGIGSSPVVIRSL